jgi:peptidoglycan/xylan/chitin deacetylase (PgdA/CDA1 family)
VEAELQMQDEDQKPLENADWRHMVAAGLYQSGLLRAFQAVSRHCEYASDNGGGEHFRRVRKPKYVVLGYHSVGTRGFPLYCRLPRRVFAGQMKYIRRHYRVLSLRQMVEELQNSSAQGQGVVVTFDDGYLGTYTDAFPVLKEYDIPATVYLTSGCVESGEVPWYDRIFLRFQRAPSEVAVSLGTKRTFRLTHFADRVDAATTAVLYLRTLPDEERQRWCDSFEKAIPVSPAELRGSMMNWEQVREMQRAGISIGCHTVSHPVLSRLGPDALQREVAESKCLIENRLDAMVEDFAFPFGKPRDCGTIGSKLLSALGLRTAMTTILGINEPGTDRFRLRRMVQGDELSIAMFAWRLQRLFFHPVDEELTAASSSAVA